jgi:hypothetical protein
MHRICCFPRIASFAPSALLLLFCCIACGELQAEEQLTVEVRETSGIARFGYPVNARFHWPGEAEPAGFQLFAGQRPVPAQFSRVFEGQKNEAWELDFNLDLLPLETKTFRIQAAAKPAEQANPHGLSLERNQRSIRILRPGLEFELPADVSGLLLGVRSPREDYLAASSKGLTWRDRKGNSYQLGKDEASGKPSFEIVKSGPLCAALQFVSRQGPAAGGVTSTVRLDFPRSKSWVRVDWALKDPDDSVAEIGAEFDLRMSPASSRPTLVDFAATTYIYATLRPSELAVFSGWPQAEKDDGRTAGHQLWEVKRGTAVNLVPYVVATEGETRSPEGWAHVMDDKLCTAIAVDRFASETADRIEVEAAGRTRIMRSYAPHAEARTSGPKRLVFWMHFVPSPPHVGAVTSPQSMQSPPSVRILAK